MEQYLLFRKNITYNDVMYRMDAQEIAEYNVIEAELMAIAKEKSKTEINDIKGSMTHGY